jgi:hypothetical protein
MTAETTGQQNSRCPGVDRGPKEDARFSVSVSEDTLRNSVSRTDESAHTLKQRVLHEIHRFVVMFLYLWVLFGLFVLNEGIILRQHGISFSSQGFALLNALVLAKVMLVAEDLNLGHWLQGKPLIYPILHEAFVFAILFICFHVLEHVVVGFFKGETIARSIPAIGGGGLAGVICVAVILFVALIPFFAFRDVSRELGPGRLNTMLFGPMVNVGEG